MLLYSRLYYIEQIVEFRQSFYYSNFGYVLSACIIETLTNKPYKQVSTINIKLIINNDMIKEICQGTHSLKGLS